MTLRRFTLSHDQQKDQWKLVNNETNRTVHTFATKEEATKRGVLSEALGSHGGSVRIEKLHGGYQEERTFPRSADPRRSKG